VLLCGEDEDVARARCDGDEVATAAKMGDEKRLLEECSASAAAAASSST
jgi:hypothetical protein